MPGADEVAAAQQCMRSGGRVTHPETVTERPWNAATPIASLQESLTPNDGFFVRNHFDMPRLDPERYLLRVEDTGRRRTSLTLADLKSLQQRRVTAVLECAGNSRRRMVPRPSGCHGATARWAAPPGKALRCATCSQMRACRRTGWKCYSAGPT